MFAGGKASVTTTQTHPGNLSPVSSSQGQHAHSEDSVPKAFKHLGMEVKHDLHTE